MLEYISMNYKGAAIKWQLCRSDWNVKYFAGTSKQLKPRVTFSLSNKMPTPLLSKAGQSEWKDDVKLKILEKVFLGASALRIDQQS